ncbi:MAG: helix-turn-helix domain-containing protein [Oscillospiraceae bacterium]
MKNMISQNLRALRARLGLSQEAAAERVGVSRQALGKWETGESAPDLQSCMALAELYGVTLDALVQYSQEEGGVPIPPKKKHAFGLVTVGERGQIVIPQKARKIFDLKAGDQLLVLGDEEQGLALLKAEWMVEMAEQLRSRKGGEQA